MYGGEITGMFKTSSAACWIENEFLGVNKKSTNVAVLSELGRYPLYVSVVLSMLKYWLRIDKMESGLLSDAYIANRSMVTKIKYSTYRNKVEWISKVCKK